MNTSKELKQKYIDHLMGMDLACMSLEDLRVYGSIVGGVLDMDKPSIFDAMSNFGALSPFGGMKGA